jgi:hypothetical protein
LAFFVKKIKRIIGFDDDLAFKPFWGGHGKPKSEISDAETEQSLLVATDG